MHTIMVRANRRIYTIQPSIHRERVHKKAWKEVCNNRKRQKWSDKEMQRRNKMRRRKNNDQLIMVCIMRRKTTLAWNNQTAPINDEKIQTQCTTTTSQHQTNEEKNARIKSDTAQTKSGNGQQHQQQTLQLTALCDKPFVAAELCF